MCCDNEPGSMPTGAPRRCPGSLSLTTFGRTWRRIRNGALLIGPKPPDKTTTARRRPPSFRSQLTALTSRLILGGARREELGRSARRVGLQEARAGRSHRCTQNNCSGALITRLLVENHLEMGESGPAPALLSINHSAASTSQPSILDGGDGNYFNCATRKKNMFMILLSQLKRQTRISASSMKNGVQILLVSK